MPQVLLVDDDPAMLKLLEVNFVLDGFEVRTAPSGEEALALVVVARPHAVVLDVTLPGIDGHEVARRLRGDPATAGVALVFLSGRSPADLGGYAAEDVPYVTKPFDPADLVALVRSLVGDAA
ncbi:MAG TPA: response regulator [Actinomycetota bacterium]